MKDRRFFVYSVIIALVVPAIIGTTYFYKLSILYPRDGYINKSTDMKELLMVGDLEITSIKPEDNVLDFIITYTSGKKDLVNYKIKLVSDDMIDDVSWHLFENILNEYTKISSGDLAKEKHISLIPYVTIRLGETHRYRLYIKNTKERTIENKIKIDIQEE